MINASSARTVDLYMLNAANIQTIFEKSKKKQLFYVVNEDICGFICICVHLYVILSPYNRNTHKI